MATMPMMLPQQYMGVQGSGANGNVPMGNGAKLITPVGADTGDNVYAPPTIVPSTAGAVASAIPTAAAAPVQGNNINWADQDYSVTGDFKDTYGAGTGRGITNVLQGMGNNTSQAVQATVANTNYAADKQYANIRAREAASGITPDSSTAALAEGDFYAGVNSQLQQTIAQLELNQEDTLLSTLLNEGLKHGGDQGFFSQFSSALGSILPAVGQVAGAVSEGFGVGGPAGAILDGISLLA